MAISFEAKCVEVRAADGAQHFVATVAVPAHLQHVWLMGIDRTRAVQVGDVGTLTYVTDRRGGRYVFAKAPSCVKSA